MNLKVHKILAKNFKGYKEFEVELNGKTTSIVGINKAGKSTIIQALRLALEREIKLGSRVVPKKTWKAELIGEFGKSSELSVILKDYGIDFDVRIDFRFTRSSDELQITASDGRKLDESFLDSIFSELCFNPDKFFLSTGKEQAKMLGVDTSEIDEKIKQYEAEKVSPARIRKRDAKKDLETIGKPEPVERISVAELLQEKAKIDEHNRKVEADLDRIDLIELSMIGITDEIEALKKKLDRLRAEKANILLVNPLPVDEINEKLNNSEAINKKADEYDRYLEKKTAFETAEKTWDQVNEEKKALEEERKAILQEQLPFENMSIDDQGGLLVDGKTFNEINFNYAQLWEKSIYIISEINPELKTIYIKNPLNLDREEDGRIKIMKDLEAEGFQFIPEIVAPVIEAGLENAILVRDNKVVEVKVA